MTNSSVFVALLSTNRVIRADLDGNGGTAIATLVEQVNAAAGIALDLVNSRIYITGNRSSSIYRLNMDGRGGINLGDPGSLLNDPLGFAVDPVAGHINVARNANKSRAGQLGWDRRSRDR